MESKFVFWAITSFIGLLFVITGVLIRTVWLMVFNDLHGWKTEIQKEGGTVTRDKFFDWCREKQAKCSEGMNCRLCEIEDWRRDMLEKGGPLTLQPHDVMCEKVTSRVASIFGEKLSDSINHYNSLIKKDLELMKKDLEIAVLSVNETIVQAVKEIKEANGRK